MTTELAGRTSANRVAEVRPQVGGIIQKRLFAEGVDVKAGQVLYHIIISLLLLILEIYQTKEFWPNEKNAKVEHSHHGSAYGWWRIAAADRLYVCTRSCLSTAQLFNSDCRVIARNEKRSDRFLE